MEGRKEDGHKPASEENILQVGLEMAQATSKCSRDPALTFTVLISCPPGKFKFYSQASVLKAPGQGDTA